MAGKLSGDYFTARPLIVCCVYVFPFTRRWRLKKPNYVFQTRCLPAFLHD